MSAAGRPLLAANGSGGRGAANGAAAAPGPHSAAAYAIARPGNHSSMTGAGGGSGGGGNGGRPPLHVSRPTPSAAQLAAAAAMVGSTVPTHLSASKDDTDGYEVSDSEMEDSVVLRDGRRFPNAIKEKHVSLMQLLAIVYFCVVGGPYGLEDAVLAGGLSWVVLLLLLLPWMLNLPIGLLTSEMACWARGTKLLMYSGQTKKVEEIADGEHVMGPDGTPRIVSNTLRCRGHTSKAPQPLLRMMDLRPDCQSASDPTQKRQFGEGDAARPKEDGLCVCCYLQCPYKTDADHIAQHEALESLHQTTEATACAMYEVQYTGKDHDMASWACTANHMLVLRWNLRPFATKSTQGVNNYGVTSIGWKYGRVAELTDFYATEAERGAALQAAQAAWRPFEACITVAAFLACSTLVQRYAVMVKAAHPMAFSLPPDDARLHTLIAQVTGTPAASAELTATTAWVLGLYAMHGAGSVISIVNHAPREQNEALRAALLAWKRQMEALQAAGVVAQDAVAATPASSTAEDASQQAHIIQYWHGSSYQQLATLAADVGVAGLCKVDLSAFGCDMRQVAADTVQNRPCLYVWSVEVVDFDAYKAWLVQHIQQQEQQLHESGAHAIDDDAEVDREEDEDEDEAGVGDELEVDDDDGGGDEADLKRAPAVRKVIRRLKRCLAVAECTQGKGGRFLHYFGHSCSVLSRDGGAQAQLLDATIFRLHSTSSACFKFHFNLLACAPDQQSAEKNEAVALVMEEQLGQLLGIDALALQKHVLNASLLGQASARPYFQFDFDGGECLRQLVTHYGLQAAGAVLPRPLLTESINIRRAMLAGVIDGSAWWVQQRGATPNLHIVHPSAAMMATVLHLARGLGCATRSAVRVREGRGSEVILALESNLREIHPTLPAKQTPPSDARQAPVWRKSSEGLEYSTDPQCVGFKLQQIQHAEYFGFELSGDRKCLLEDFTVTHNSAMPQNGGYILWVSRAFGNFWGHMEGWFSWSSSLFDTALYPFLIAAYCNHFLLAYCGVSLGYWSMYGVRIALCLGVMALNLFNVQMQGTISLVFAFVCLLPFVALTVLGFPQIEWKAAVSEFVPIVDVNVGLMLSAVLWVCSGWDSPGTVAGDVKTPKKTYPRAVTIAVFLVMLTNLLPVLVAFSIEKPEDAYASGHAFWALVAFHIGGGWLQLLVIVVAVLGNLNLLHVLLTSSSWSLYALALPGLLDVPLLTKLQGRFRTPWVCIAINTAGLLLCCLSTFAQLIQVTMALNGLALILQCMSLVWLRITAPRMKRPYRIPLGSMGVAAFMFLPIAISLALLFTIEHAAQLIVGGFTFAGVVAFLLARLVERVHQQDTGLRPPVVDLQEVFEDVGESVESKPDDSFPDLGFRSSLLVEQLPESIRSDPTEVNDNVGDLDHNDAAAVDDDDDDRDDDDDEEGGETLNVASYGHTHSHGADDTVRYGSTDLPSVTE